MLELAREWLRQRPQNLKTIGAVVFKTQPFDGVIDFGTVGPLERVRQQGQLEVRGCLLDLELFLRIFRVFIRKRQRVATVCRFVRPSLLLPLAA